ncbi:hypothetical protein WJX79_006574 [Trebouxia sp. C0005]
MASNDLEERFKGIGLADSTAKTAVKNKKLTHELEAIIQEAGVLKGCPKQQGTLLYDCASKYPDNAKENRKQFMLDFIMTGKIQKSTPNLEGAFRYLKQHVGNKPLTSELVHGLEEAAGVGVVITPQQIDATVDHHISKVKPQLIEQRYTYPTAQLFREIREELIWADGGAVKKATDAAILSLLGPKTEDDLQAGKKKPAKKAAPVDEKARGMAAAAVQMVQEEATPSHDVYGHLPKPGENDKVHKVVTFSPEAGGGEMRIANTAAQLQAHLKATGGKVMTRFPPEPNGYLHIGHAKAMFVSFGMAEHLNGECVLRFDDTNPEAEKQEYIDHIQDIVAWMGWQPSKITYSSDHFEQLYQLSIQLIKGGHAYVDHQTADQIKLSRKHREPSPWRDRPIAESLALFEDMRRGLVDEGQATLRMRGDHKNDVAVMWDLIAYRVKFAHHPHAGDTWCIYPSYDYTHCLVDALENITHSLCTLEFETRRASYYWLLEVLEQYKPVVWEYARLNLTYNVLSKRKLNRLVTEGFVEGWDDPRLLTLAGLRRRGVTSTGINNFCREIGITRTGGELPLHILEYHVRADLHLTSPRTLAVLHPLKVVITNLPEDHCEMVDAKVFPFPGKDETYQVPFTRVVYIEQDDFREQDQKKYFGLAPGKSVLLRYAYVITCTGFHKEGDRVTEVHVEGRKVKDDEKPPKGVLHWVGQPKAGQEPARFEARLYDRLFSTQTPGSKKKKVEDGQDSAAATGEVEEEEEEDEEEKAGDSWLNELNPDSRTVVQGCMANIHLANAKPGDRFQFERQGFFCVDPDSQGGKLVCNRTCTLNESKDK